MNAKRLAPSDLETLASLLERRLEVIADTGWRDRDADAHLAELATVSERIAGFYAEHAASLPPRLAHFLANASFEKALLWAREQLAGEG